MNVNNADLRPTGLRARVARFILGKEWPPVPTQVATTTAGVTDTTWEEFKNLFFKVSQERLDVYDDVEEMENSIDEVATALDILADEAVNSERGSQESFRIVYEGAVPSDVQNLIGDALERTRLKEKVYAIARDLLLYGDEFLQPVVDGALRVARVMYMPPRSMVRNEDLQGLLLPGEEQGQWAFEQYVPRTNRFIAGFYPWQIDHLRWNRRGSDKYGRSICWTARMSWRKLRAMEEALSINWLTRAFARLLFIIDVTGMSDKEAGLYIKRFKNDLTMQKIASGVIGPEAMSVVKDIFIGKGYQDFAGKIEPGLTDVKVLDTSSTGFWNLGPIEYYRGKILTSMRVPKAYMGLERDINAKATLVQQDRRFARTVKRVQSLLSEHISHTMTLALILQGFTPTEVKYSIEWPNPSRLDIAEEAATLHAFARADETLQKMGIVDPEYIALQHVGMTPTQWNAVKDRIIEQASRAAPGEGEEIVEEE